MFLNEKNTFYRLLQIDRRVRFGVCALHTFVRGGDMNYTYIVKCRDATLYTGWTTDLDGRVNAHNTGKGAKYTKTRRPVELVYFERFETKQGAMRREWEIKQLSRKDKLKLIEGRNTGEEMK